MSSIGTDLSLEESTSTPKKLTFLKFVIKRKELQEIQAGSGTAFFSS
jgi:hypothetical protein